MVVGKLNADVLPQTIRSEENTMPRIRRDEKSLYVKFRGTFARPVKKGQTTNPLAPSGTFLREMALVEVELVLGDNKRLYVKVVPNGKYVVAEGKFTEVWYLDGEVRPPLKKKTKWQGKKGKKRGKTKRPVQTRDVGRSKGNGKKVGKKKPNRHRRNRSHLGRSQNRSN